MQTWLPTSKLNQQAKTSLVLLSYRRPEFLEERLREILAIEVLPVYVFVDKDESAQGQGLYQHHKNIEERYENRKINWVYRERNFGITQNLLQAVDEGIKLHENCVVIEDDISVNPGPLTSLIEVLEDEQVEDFFTAGLFSGIPKLGILPNKNYWRRTPFFSAWGWGVRKRRWQVFREEQMKCGLTTESYEMDFWKKLSEERKNSWEYRLNRIRENPSFTWDFHVQHFSFQSGLFHLLPVYRAVENLGFEDKRATNTKTKKPNWYIGSATSNSILKTKIESNILSHLMMKIDSLTWFGDSSLLITFKKYKNILRKRIGRKKMQ